MTAPGGRRWAHIFKREARTEIEDELAFHIEERVRDYVARGLSEDAARAAATARLGNLDAVRVECAALLTAERRTEARRELVKFSVLDFKLGVRMLARYPGLTIVGGLAMALAITIGAGAFEIATQVVNPRLPFAGGDRMVALRNRDAATWRVDLRTSHDFRLWRDELASITELGAYSTVDRNLSTGKTTSAEHIAEISATAFSITGVPPLLGRALNAADESPGAANVIVLGYQVWQSRFDGDRSVIGRVVRLGNEPAVIVGVMPRGFKFPYAHDAWTPLRMSALAHKPREGPELFVFGRLARGVELEEAQAELTAFGQRLAKEFPGTHQHLRPSVMPYARSYLGDALVGPPSIGGLVNAAIYSGNLFFIALVVLVCANIALLMFARAAARESEIIVRSALGASRGRIVAQLVAEALVLGALAAILGLSAAGFALRLALSLAGGIGIYSLPFWFTPDLSWPSIAYAVALTLGGATIAGVMPALKVTHAHSARLRRITPGSGGLQFGGVWSAVIITQVAVTVLFVATAGYVINLTARLDAFEMGFKSEEFLSVGLRTDQAIPSATFEKLRLRVEADPNVSAVTFASTLPGQLHWPVPLDVESDTGVYRVQIAAIDLNYFDTFGASILEGRGFHSGDTLGDARAVVVNQRFLEHVLRGENAIGRRVRFEVSHADDQEAWGPWLEIVGVVKGVAMTADVDMETSGIYLPRTKDDTRVQMAVHVKGDPALFAPTLHEIGLAVDPALRLTVRTLDDARNTEVRWWKIWIRIMIAASVLVLALSLAGIYAIMAFTVSRRTSEIGVRVALGADKRRIVASIFKRPLTQVAAGIAAGIAIIIPAMGGISSVTGALSILAFAILMAAVCMLACVVPVRRALRIQPMDALRGRPFTC